MAVRLTGSFRTWPVARSLSVSTDKLLVSHLCRAVSRRGLSSGRAYLCCTLRTWFRSLRTVVCPCTRTRMTCRSTAMHMQHSRLTPDTDGGLHCAGGWSEIDSVSTRRRLSVSGLVRLVVCGSARQMQWSCLALASSRPRSWRHRGRRSVADCPRQPHHQRLLLLSAWAATYPTFADSGHCTRSGLYTRTQQARLLQRRARRPSANQLSRLQSVLRAAARLVLGLTGRASVSAAMRNSLHWLGYPQRVSYKLCLLMCKCLQGWVPEYLARLCVPIASVAGRSRLRSADDNELVIPRTETVTLGDRAFSSSGPASWNSLPPALRCQSVSLQCFKHSLKHSSSMIELCFRRRHRRLCDGTFVNCASLKCQFIIYYYYYYAQLSQRDRAAGCVI